MFVTSETPSQERAEGESDNIRLFTRDELDELTGETWEDTLDICRHMFDVYLPAWERVALSKDAAL